MYYQYNFESLYLVNSYILGIGRLSYQEHTMDA